MYLHPDEQYLNHAYDGKVQSCKKKTVTVTEITVFQQSIV